MGAENESPRSTVFQALATRKGIARDAIADTPENLRAGLEVVHREEGAPRAIALTEALLDDELRTLTWPPAFGLALIRWALQLGTPPSGLLERACTYLSLYYQELDDDIARCRAQLDTQRESARAEAHRLLTEALARLEPTKAWS